MKACTTTSLCLMAMLLMVNNATVADDHAAFIASCKETINQYFMTRDRFDAEGYANTFTVDGELIGHNTVIKGREALAARIDGERGQTFDRHILSNMAIVPTGETTATGTIYTTVYQVDADTVEKLPVTNFNIYMVIYTDTYRMTPEGCKIATREAMANFMQKVSD